MDAGASSPYRPQITVRSPAERLPAELVAAVVTAARSAERADRIPPLNDDQLIALEHPEAVASQTTVTHLVITEPDGSVTGYAQLESATSTGTLFVTPDRRGRGLGRQLLDDLSGRAADADRLSLWAPGDHPAARLLAHRAGLRVVRTLLIMSRPLDHTLPTATAPDGIALRPFVPGPSTGSGRHGSPDDQSAFLSVNARAFVHHPEQGRLDERGFAAKASEPWFDPAGFFLAVDHRQTDPGLPGHTTDGRVLGFHWTKQRGPEPGEDAGGPQVGEVYVIGVDPDAEGRGLAKALLSRGLTHLREHGAGRVILYVEGDHDRAVGLYERYGFSVSRRDVMYARHLDAETTQRP